MQGFSRSNTIGRSLPTNQGRSSLMLKYRQAQLTPFCPESYCCGSSYSGETSIQFYQRYIPYAASLQVVGAATYTVVFAI